MLETTETKYNGLPGDSSSSKPTYSTRKLLGLTAFCGICFAWVVDHSTSAMQIAKLESRVAKAEQLEDMLERKFMTPTVIGRKVTDFPELRLLVDHTIVPGDEFYRHCLDKITYPDVIDESSDHEIFYFDLTNTGIEGDPFDFFLLVSDGVILQMQRGESLCL